jgi:predicted DNA-binding transcriptional regulator AlpA
VQSWRGSANDSDQAQMSENPRAPRESPLAAIGLAPRGLSRTEVAAYIGVSATLFDQMVADGRMPGPKQINSRLVWDRQAIDRAFTTLPGGEEPEEDSSWDFEVGELAPVPKPRHPRYVPSEGAESATDRFELERYGRVLRTMSPVAKKAVLVEWQKAQDELLRRSPLNRREEIVMTALGERPRGRHHLNTVKQAGIDTWERLVVRGFVEVFPSEKWPDRTAYIALTDAGAAALTSTTRRY